MKREAYDVIRRVVKKERTDLLVMGFLDKLINEMLDRIVDNRTLPVQFPLPLEANVSLLVNNVNRRPHRVPPRVPVLILYID